jgi:hypothetical protein
MVTRKYQAEIVIRQDERFFLSSCFAVYFQILVLIHAQTGDL